MTREKGAETLCVSTDKAVEKVQVAGEKKKKNEAILDKDTNGSKKQRIISSFEINTDRRPSITHGISVKRAPRIGKEFQEDGPCGGSRLPGQLRVCTRSVFFEPDDVQRPVMRIPYVYMDELEGNASENGIRVVAHRYTTMKPKGRDAPYTFCTGRQVTWWFRLSYASVADIIPYAQQMLMSSRLGGKEMKEMHDVFLSQLEAEQRFDLGSLEDPTCERIVFEKPAMLVSRLTKERGKFVVTDVRFYFQPLHNISGGEHVRSHRLSAVYAAARRRSSLRDVGIELFLKMPAKRRTTVKHWGCSNAFFVFRSREDREDALEAVLDHVGEDGSIAGGLLEAEGRYCQLATMAWQKGMLSNFEYLMYCNLAAGRSFHDLTQYPVFPWIIKDYTSDEIDLQSPDAFRDLSKPIGAINKERLQVFQQRYEDMVEMQMHGGEEPFLYGTHYSCPGYTLFWLVRSMPEHMLRLQNGKFDAPDRSFTGIREAWESVCHSPTDVKELIPEFFCPGADEFLKNSRGLALGCRQNGKPVGDVELPPWARNDARSFLEKQREALESPYVSANLHHWIDLIFGVCQRGEDALKNNNVFRQLTYEGLVNIDDIEDPVEKRSMEVAIAEFGQCPRQIFFRDHPQRRVCRSSFEAYQEICKAMDGSEIIAKVLHVVQSLLDSPPDDVASSNDSDMALLRVLEIKKEEYKLTVETMDSKKECVASGSTTDSQSSFQQRLQTVVSTSKRAGSNLLKYGNETLAAKVSSSLQALSPRKNGLRMNDVPSLRQHNDDCRQKKVASWETSMFSGGLTSVEINPLVPSEVSISFQDGHIVMFDLQTKERRRRCDLSHGSITCTAWVSQNILASGFDGAIYKYDTSTGSKSSFGAHNDIVSCLRTSDDVSLVYSSSWDEAIKVWDLETAPWGQHDGGTIPQGTISSPAGGIWSMEVLVNDSVVAGTEDGTVFAFDCRSNRMTMEAQLCSDFIGGVCSCQDGTMIGIACADGVLRMLDSRRSDQVVMSRDFASPLLCCRSWNDILYLGDEDGRLHACSVHLGLSDVPSSIPSIHFDAPLSSISVSASNERSPQTTLAAGYEDGLLVFLQKH